MYCITYIIYILNTIKLRNPMISFFNLYSIFKSLLLCFSIIYKWMEEDYSNSTRLIQTQRNLVHEFVGDIVVLKIIMYNVHSYYM